MAQDEEQSPIERQPSNEPRRAVSLPDLSDHLAAELGGLEALLAARASSEASVDEADDEKA